MKAEWKRGDEQGEVKQSQVLTANMLARRPFALHLNNHIRFSPNSSFRRRNLTTHQISGHCFFLFCSPSERVGWKMRGLLQSTLLLRAETKELRRSAVQLCGSKLTFFFFFWLSILSSWLEKQPLIKTSNMKHINRDTVCHQNQIFNELAEP